jgi:PAS domain S-box-containing protein
MIFSELDETFQAFLDISVDPAAVVDDDGKFLLWNSEFAKLLKVDTLESKNCYDFTHPEDIEYDRKLHLECIQKERDFYTIRKRYIDSKGKIIFVRLNVRYVCRKNRCFSIAVATDMTVEHEVEMVANFRNKLLNAIDRHDFILHYQPIFALRDSEALQLKKGEIFAHEALVRWKDYDAIIYPDAFLPTLRLLGMENQLCKLVLDMVISKIARTDKRICINIEPLTLALEEFNEILFSTLQKHKVTNLSLVVLEIVESEALEEILEDKLKFLSKHFLISLDDWGSKYNNLARIGRLPVHLIKLDKSLFQNPLIVERSISLIKELGFSAVAEGVENQDQSDWLTSIGCDLAQGYLYGRPEIELII